MAPENGFLDEIERTVGDGLTWSETLARILQEMSADSGTIHLLGDDGVLHLKAASAGIPQIVLDTIKAVPVGKGMAGLAVERKQPGNACNIQTDASGDVRPGALPHRSVEIQVHSARQERHLDQRVAAVDGENRR